MTEPHAFLLEKFAFHQPSAAITAQAAVRTNHAMAGQDERERVLGECVPDRPRGCRLPEAFCDLAVGAYCPARDALDSLQDPGLERWTPCEVNEIEGELDRFACQLLDEIIRKPIDFGTGPAVGWGGGAGG